jgi:hypothetical protein
MDHMGIDQTNIVAVTKRQAADAMHEAKNDFIMTLVTRRSYLSLQVLHDLLQT